LPNAGIQNQAGNQATSQHQFVVSDEKENSIYGNENCIWNAQGIEGSCNKIKLKYNGNTDQNEQKGKKDFPLIHA
jgi:hypothetical protein